MNRKFVLIFFAINYAICYQGFLYYIEFLDSVNTGSYHRVQKKLFDSEDIDELLEYRYYQNNALESAVSLLDEKMVMLLMAAGSDPANLDAFGSSALHQAAKEDAPKILRLLLINCDANCLETRNKSGDTALMLAVRNARNENISTLLLANANANDVNPKTNESIVQAAIRHGNHYILKQLAMNGASMDATDGKGRTPVMLAVLEKKLDILKIILDKGGRPNVKSGLHDDYSTALHLAVRVDDLVAAQMLATRKRISLDVKDIHGRTPAMLAFANKRYDILKVILENGGEQYVESERYGGRTTFLHMIVHEGDLEAVKFFLSWKGVLLDVQDMRVGTVAMAAILNKRNDILDVILKRGADPNVRSVDDGSTALHLAARLGDVEMVKTLLNIKYISLDAKDMQGRTPALVAVFYRNTDVLNVFLEYGVDPNAKSGKHNDGGTALHLAARLGDVRMVKTLLNIKGISLDAKDMRGRTPAIVAVVNLMTDVLNIFLEYGVNPNVKSGKYDGYITALKLAIPRGDLETVRLLLSRDGIWLDDKDGDGRTPVMLAVVNKKNDILNLILSKGANPNVKSEKTEDACGTALHLAIERNDLDSVNLLLETNVVDIKIKNNEHRTPMKMAKNLECIEIIDALRVYKRKHRFGGIVNRYFCATIRCVH